MKKLLLCGAMAAGCCLASTAQSKINNAGLVQLDEFHRLKQEMSLISPMKAAACSVDVNIYVTVAQGYTVADLYALGLNVIDSTDDMAIVNIPIDEVEALAGNDCVKSISFSRQAAPLMDKAMELSFVGGIHDGSATGIDKAYRGKGVYVGLYDTGLDPNHVNFTDGNGNTRVKAVYLANNGKVSSYDTPENVALFTTDDTGESHGTHVLGTITGSDKVNGTYAVRNGNSTEIKNGNIPYHGLAPDADILVGCGSFDDASINAGIGAVIDRAKRDGKPVIVNLSLGHNRGSHDPRETVNRYLDSRAQDAIIVVAAGNEGDSDMSIQSTFTKESTLRTSMVPAGSNAKATIYYSAEFWADDNRPFEGAVVLFDKISRKEILSKPITGRSGSVSFSTSTDSQFGTNFESGSSVSARWGVDADTQRFNLYMTNKTTAKNSDVVVGVVIYTNANSRINGYTDAFNGYSQDEVRFASQTGWARSTSGTAVGSINGMACGYNTISVGAWVSRVDVPNLGGGKTTYNAGSGVGSLANFSSYGMSGDGRQLPIVCAPGAQIVSSVSRYWVSTKKMQEAALSAKYGNGDDIYPWYYMQGTSMACPFVSGTIALWLEACPGLRANEVKQIIEKTSDNDSFTSTLDQKGRWGAGKINALAGLKEAIVMSASVESTLVDNADQNLMVVAKGGKQFEVSCPGVNNLSCSLYNLQGAAVASADDSGDTIDLDASSLQEGIYVLSVNAGGQKLSRKLVVK